tara:strand:+ start:234 stop:722 length:489 start_codon:yes stop_codon:yes gene_type:complete
MFKTDELMQVMKCDGFNHRIIPFHPRHIHMTEFRDFDQEILDGYGRPHIEDYSVEGLSFTAIYKGEVYVIFGLYPLWRGVAEAWMLPSKNLELIKLKFHKASLRFFEYAPKKLKLHRVQSFVRSTNVQAIKWVEMCYFVREGLLQKYGPDINDYFAYGRLYQ